MEKWANVQFSHYVKMVPRVGRSNPSLSLSFIGFQTARRNISLRLSELQPRESAQERQDEEEGPAGALGYELS